MKKSTKILIASVVFGLLVLVFAIVTRPPEPTDKGVYFELKAITVSISGMDPLVLVVKPDKILYADVSTSKNITWLINPLKSNSYPDSYFDEVVTIKQNQFKELNDLVSSGRLWKTKDEMNPDVQDGGPITIRFEGFRVLPHERVEFSFERKCQGACPAETEEIVKRIESFFGRQI